MNKKDRSLGNDLRPWAWCYADEEIEGTFKTREDAIDSARNKALDEYEAYGDAAEGSHKYTFELYRVEPKEFPTVFLSSWLDDLDDANYPSEVSESCSGLLDELSEVATKAVKEELIRRKIISTEMWECSDRAGEVTFVVSTEDEEPVARLEVGDA